MKIEFEAVAGGLDGADRAKARYRLWETNESWAFSAEEINEMLNGNSEVDGKKLEPEELQKGLNAIQALKM